MNPLFSLFDRDSNIRRHRAPGMLLFILLVLGSTGAGIYAFLPALSGQERTTSPHGNIKISCEKCHTVKGWKALRPSPEFNHKDTSFPLQGMHTGLSCRQCHINLAFSHIGDQCADCHADLHRRQMGSNCEQCHSVRGWDRIRRNVNGHLNRFPLIGAHTAVECESCHTSAAVGLFRGLSTDCISCHDADYRNATTVNHVEAGFSPQCETCHSTDRWNAGFNHAALAGFALTGAHAQLDCVQCHIGYNFKGTLADCASCHLQEYTQTTNPNHLTADFSHDCSICHSSAAWIPSSFNHGKTHFPLTGSHVGLPCETCHSSGQYAGLPANCDSCHLDRYNTATNPNHVTGNYPKDCSICHSTSAWTPANVNHALTRFPLTGAHVTVACTSCHINGVYTGTPTDCYSCHSREYTTVTDPNHVTAGFPRDCAACHSTATWSGATFTHTQFPIYSGTHANRWTSCSDCHTNSSNYAVFSCTTSCHDRTSMDSRHRGISGYVYNSTNCYSCHPSGRAG